MELTIEEAKWVESQVYLDWPLQYRENELCLEKRQKIGKIREASRQRYIKEVIQKRSIMTKNIAGINIELNHPDIVKAKTASDLEKLGLFSSLNEDERKAAFAELLKSKEPKEASGKEKIKEEEKN